MARVGGPEHALAGDVALAPGYSSICACRSAPLRFHLAGHVVATVRGDARVRRRLLGQRPREAAITGDDSDR